MKVFLDCIPCFLKQALEAARLATSEVEVQQQALRVVLDKLAQISWDTSPPHIGRAVHQIIKQVSGNPDPYAILKRHSNEVALKLCQDWEKEISKMPNPFEAAVKLSLAGNIIDFGARPGEIINIEKEIETVMEMPLSQDELSFFEKAVSLANRILFLGDNAGEIAFDEFLLKQIGPGKVVYVVKAKPIINDATMQDAREVGLTDIVEVVDNGSDYPGTVLESCSESFRLLYEQADLIIAKGQGNYETLSETQRPIFFLLRVKCPVIARDIKKEVGSLVIQPKNVYI